MVQILVAFGALLVGNIFTIPSASAAPIIDSIYADTAELANSGWAICSTPITWSVDPTGLRPAQARREQHRLARALARWSNGTGLTFIYSGAQRFSYSLQDSGLHTLDGAPEPRRDLRFAFLPASTSPLLAGNGLGFGSPSVINPSTREILNGKAVFRRDHVRRNSASAPAELMSLYLHEIGHALGITHATNPSDVMYPIVRTRTTLSSMDTASVRALLKPCSA